VLQLQREEHEPLADRTQQYQDRRSHRSHPAPPDPEAGEQRAQAKEHRQDAHRALGESKRQQRRPFQGQPSQRRSLVEPQRYQQLREAAIAHVQREHLFVDP
jgi:hypothetical protein